MVGHGGSSAGSYLADPTSPIPSHCASIVATSTVRVKNYLQHASMCYIDNTNKVQTEWSLSVFFSCNKYSKCIHMQFKYVANSDVVECSPESLIVYTHRIQKLIYLHLEQYVNLDKLTSAFRVRVYPHV